MDTRLEDGRKFDLEAQQRILEIAVRLESENDALASRAELVQIGSDLGISASAIDQAIAQYEKAPASLTAKPKQSIPLSTKLLVGCAAQFIPTSILCNPWLRPNPGAASSLLLFVIAATLALWNGASAGSDSRLLGKLLKVEAWMLPASFILTYLLRMVTYSPYWPVSWMIGPSMWLVGFLMFVSLIGASMRSKSTAPFARLLSVFSGPKNQQV